MNRLIATIVIGPRSLIRDGLVSLLASHSYQVVGGYASTADVEKSSLTLDAPRLLIFSAMPADEVASAADSIRKQWPESKIVLLIDTASSADLQKMLASDVD